MLNKRTHILFDENLWKILINLAEDKKISVGKLVRDAVEDKYAKNERHLAKIKAVDKLLSMKRQYKTKSKKSEKTVDLIHRMREERTQHIWNVIQKAKK